MVGWATEIAGRIQGGSEVKHKQAGAVARARKNLARLVAGPCDLECLLGGNSPRIWSHEQSSAKIALH